MNKIIDWFKERNNWHYLGGAIAAFLFYMMTFEAVQIVGRVLLSGFFTLVGSIVWEMFWKDVKKIIEDPKDVKRSMIGWAIGIVITVITHLLIK